MSSRRLMLLIDHLGPGGAQRQMTLLATLLKDKGLVVTVVVYHAHDFFGHVLASAGIEVNKIKGKNLFTRTISLKSLVAAWKPDAIIAYLDTPSLIAELASLPRKKFGLVVSERTGKIGKASLKDRLRLKLHRFADVIVTNSNKVKSFIVKTNSKLEPKIHVIHNGVEFEQFSEVKKQPNVVGEFFEIAVLARYRDLKNPFNILKAIHAMSSEASDNTKPKQKPIRLTWYGNNNFIDGKPSKYSTTYLRLKEEVERLGLEEQFVMKLHTQDVAGVYQRANAICLGSFYEGFSNTLCEAVACGKPVLASNVCDNPILVEHEQNGFLFEPDSVDSIASAFGRIAALSPAELEALGDHSFVLAEKYLSPERMVYAYLQVIELVCN